MYPKRQWNVVTEEKIIYLTFDDGPHPIVTPFVLDELQKHKSKATFFCIGKNVVEYPAIYTRLLDEGHVTGNHTHNHLNGWKTNEHKYLADICEAKRHIFSNYYRPPYGRIRSKQARQIKTILNDESAKIIMWDVLSGDFDESISSEKCFRNVINNAGPGSIVVFHDSEKAFSKLKYVLPKVLLYFAQKGYQFQHL